MILILLMFTGCQDTNVVDVLQVALDTNAVDVLQVVMMLMLFMFFRLS